MARWRSPELEALIGGPLDALGLTEPALTRLKTDGVPEGDQIDYKRVVAGEAPYPKNSQDKHGWMKEQEFAKDVAALANHRGGMLVIGVGEDDKTGVANNLTPVVGVTDIAEEQRFRQALVKYLVPYYEPYFVSIPATSGGWYMAVVVPPSQRSPHAVVGEKGALHYPLRSGRHIIWLSEHEVAERYRRRTAAQEDEERRLARVADEGWRMLRSGFGIWLYVAVVPEVPVTGSLDRTEMGRIKAWAQDNFITSPRGNSLITDGASPSPGRMTFTAGVAPGTMDIHPFTKPDVDETTTWGSLAELWVDGSAYVAVPTNSSAKGGEVGHYRPEDLADDMIILTDAALRWCASQAGSWGVASLVAGLFSAGIDKVRLGRAVMLVQSDGQSSKRIPGTRKVSGAPTVSSTADLGSVASVQDRLAITHTLLARLLHHFGWIEPSQIRSDGSLVPARFGTAQYGQALKWAQDNDVAYAEMPSS